MLVSELCDLLTTSASGKSFLRLQDALLFTVQAFSLLADVSHTASMYGGNILSDQQLNALKQALEGAILKVCYII